MFWYFYDIMPGNLLGVIEVPHSRHSGIKFIVNVTRIDDGIMLYINGENIKVPFDKIISEQGYKIRCYKALNRLKLIIT